MLNESEITFFEHPREKGLHTWLGIGLFRFAYFKKYSLKTKEITTIDKLEGLAKYPKISPCGKYIVYTIKNEVIVKDIKSGRKIPIGKRHSPFWTKNNNI